MSKMMRNYLIGLSIAIVIYATVVSWFIKRDILLPAELLDTIILFILASATIFYAMRTSDIAEATREQAKAAKEQADASVRMAKDMRKQTETLRETVSISVRPFVSIEVLNISGGHNYPFEPPDALYVELQNTGKGPARNLVLTCEAQDKKVEYSKIELPSLNVGDKQQFSIHRTTAISDDGVRVAYVILEALYNDELEKAGYTTLQIGIDEGEWKPGETTSGTSRGLFGSGDSLFGGKND